MKYQESEYEVLFKGTDSNMTCRGFQFEMNKEYTIDNGRPVELCRNGFHACSSPEFVNDFYKMFSYSKNRLFRIKGHVVERDKHNYKVVCDSIMFVEEINLEELIKAILEKNYEHPYVKYSETFFRNFHWRVKSMTDYEKLQTFEEKVSYLLNNYWSTKYLTIKQMKLLVDTLSSMCLMHKFFFFNHYYSIPLDELIESESFPELRKILARSRESDYYSNCSKSYEDWYSDNLKRNSRKKSKNS